MTAKKKAKEPEQEPAAEAGKKRTCFVIGPIGKPGSPERKRAEDTLDLVFAPAARDCGYADPVRADQDKSSGIITRQIIRHLEDDDLVIADLFGRNANVFYELAVRHVVRKPVVLVCGPDEELPFDVHGMRALPLDHTDPRLVIEGRRKLADCIKKSESDPDAVLSPISEALRLKPLEESGRPEDRLLLQVRDRLDLIDHKLGERGHRRYLGPEALESAWRADTVDAIWKRVPALVPAPVVEEAFGDAGIVTHCELDVLEPVIYAIDDDGSSCRLRIIEDGTDAFVLKEYLVNIGQHLGLSPTLAVATYGALRAYQARQKTDKAPSSSSPPDA